MSKKTIALIVAAIAIGAFLYVFNHRENKSTTAPRSVVFAVENDLATLDPTKAQEPYTLRVIGQVMEGLVTLDSSGQIKPALAESWSANKTFDAWTFHIRKGVLFHENGMFGESKTRELTADDVAFSFQRVVAKDSYPAFVLGDTVKGVAAYQKGDVENVEGIKLIGPNDVEIQLSHPDPQFLNRITSPWFTVYPKEVAKLASGAFGKDTLVGTGPFKLVSRNDGEVVMERNSHYWGTTAGNIEKLTFRVIKNEQILLTEYQNMKVDIIRVPMKLIPVVADVSSDGAGRITLKQSWQDKSKIDAFSTFNSHFMGFNCTKLDQPLRRAINLAIDRREIVNVITNGTAKMRSGTLPSSLRGYEPPEATKRNIEEAKRELALSTFKPEKDTLNLLVHEKDSAEQIGELIQSQLKEIGITVKLTKLDYNNVIGKMISGDFDSFILSFEYVFSAPGTILNNVFNSSKIPVPNFWRYNNKEVDGMLEKFQTVSDLAEANTLAQAVEKRIAEDPPAAFLFEEVTPVLYRKDISGLQFNGHSVPLLWEIKLP